MSARFASIPASLRVPVTVIRDSGGFVAQRIVACIVNIACDIAQQRIATPTDIDLAVTLGLGYPQGPLALVEHGRRHGRRPPCWARLAACIASIAGASANASPALATLLRDDFVHAYERDLPAVVKCFTEDFEACIAHLRFPLRHRKVIRTTNLLERLNQEIKRRTLVVRIFPNQESCLRLIRALCAETHETWLEDNRYINMDLLREQKKQALKLAA